jgi:DNA-binding NarL/FixJ family response regulator
MDTAHPNPSCPRILIADDHAIFAEALRAYIEKTYTVIGVVADGRPWCKKPSGSSQM